VNSGKTDILHERVGDEVTGEMIRKYIQYHGEREKASRAVGPLLGLGVVFRCPAL